MLYYLVFRTLELLLLFSIVVVPTTAFVFILLQFKKYYTKLYVWGLLAIILIYFNKLFLGYTLAHPDFNRFLVPFFNFFGQSLRSFSAPLWNSNFGYGFDNWRIFTAPFFGPFTFLSAFFDVYKFLSIYLIEQHFILLLGSFVFGKTLKMKNYEAFAFAIFWTFNGWVCMRLNQGVGYEYLISYKWLPWALASVNLLIQKGAVKNILLLGLCIGFLFEGTPNVGVVGSFLVLLYLLLKTQFVNFGKNIRSFGLASLLALLFFLPKLLPALFAQSTLSYSNRLTWGATGWRAGLINMKDFSKYFFPFNGNRVSERAFFTPGMFGFLLMLFFIPILIIEFRRKSFKPLNLVFLTLFIVGLVLTTENWFAFNIWQLPILNDVTRIPTSLIFITTAIPYFMVFGFDFLIDKLGKMFNFIRVKKKVFWILCSLGIFFEILVGIKFFGIESYTFDFLKFKPKEELSTFGYLRNYESFPIYAVSPADMVMPMYVSSVFKITSLNTIHYFLGNVLIDETLSHHFDTGVLLYNPKIVVSVKDNNSSFLNLKELYTIDDYAHMERSYQMDRVKLIGKWDGDIRVYENINYNSAWKNTSKRFNEFAIDTENISKDSGLLPLSYNPYWVSRDGAKLDLDIVSGLTRIEGSNNMQIRLLYFPWIVYASFLLMYVGFLIIFIFRGRFVSKGH